MRSLIYLAAILPLFADAKPIQAYHLSNGLTVIVKPDKRAPVVISEICYKVGSSYEYGGITGISHMLEHMMFRGTSRYPDGQFNRLLASNGAIQNAFTSNDVTCYYQELAASKLALSFELEADRMQNLTLNPKLFDKEHQVVMEERRMRIDDNPVRQAYERFNAAAFVSSPYHHLTIGWMNDIQNLQVEDIKNWYQRWYAPNNANLVVVGDVEPKQVYDLAQQYFGAIPAKAIMPPKPQLEVQSLGPTALTINLPQVQVPWLALGYHVPSLVTAMDKADAYGLELLASILDGGASSRLDAQLLRGQELASAIEVSYDLTSRMNTLFIITASPSAKHKLKELQQAILQQLNSLQTDLIPPAELARAKTQLIASKTYARDSISQQANELSALVSVGLPWQLEANYSQAIQAISAPQLQQLARRYFNADNLTMAELPATARS